MIQKRWLVCIVAAMSLLCGCSTKESNILPPASVQQETGAEDEAMKEPEAGGAAGQQESQMSEETDEPEAGAHNESDMPKTKEAFPEITVIDTLPAVDETVPRELTPLPSRKSLTFWLGRRKNSLSGSRTEPFPIKSAQSYTRSATIMMSAFPYLMADRPD